jgi:hypothetical protein
MKIILKDQILVLEKGEVETSKEKLTYPLVLVDNGNGDLTVLIARRVSW